MNNIDIINVDTTQLLESALDRFRRLLPRHVEAADREAMQFRRAMPKPWALKMSELWPNDDERIVCIVVDVDIDPTNQIDPVTHENLSIPSASGTWIDAGVAQPNLILENPTSGHAQLVWLLEDVLWPKQQPKAPRYAEAIQRALTRAIPGGDRCYTWPTASMHNPFSSRYRVREVRRTPYRLNELAQGLDLETRHSTPRQSRREDIMGLSIGTRNEGLFRHLLHVAYHLMRRSTDDEAYCGAVMEYASALNATFNPPMDSKELSTIVGQVLRYRPFSKRDRAGELKAKRHAEGRSREAYEAPTRQREREAHRLRAIGKTIAEIAATLGVVVRTVMRYLSKSVETVIGVIPIQGNTSGSAPKGVPFPHGITVQRLQTRPFADGFEVRNGSNQRERRDGWPVFVRVAHRAAATIATTGDTALPLRSCAEGEQRTS